MNKILRIYICFFLCLVMGAALVTSCGNRPASKTKEQVMQEKLEERLNRWKYEMVTRCVREIEDRAVAIVDSSILERAKATRDTSGRLLVPERPVKPEFIPPADTTPVKPFIRATRDSLN